MPRSTSRFFLPHLHSQSSPHHPIEDTKSTVNNNFSAKGMFYYYSHYSVIMMLRSKQQPIESTATMRYHPTSKGFWAFLVLSQFVILTNCYRHGEQAVVLRPAHRARIVHRAAFGSAAIIPNDDHDSPAAYDFGNPDATTSSTSAGKRFSVF